ncbi:hypothetical protein ABB05_12430 [Lederbergia galactosidilytica]|uniref:Fe/B12 periplasmic-binding domain-containing protein n=2 Tax=Lederbergia galactosidilytica TaxID=217031 RepID=A0A177ZSC7_9BACI|nr:hypothetical protein ABB05_12430 [Lederbergia galactosidilytica]
MQNYHDIAQLLGEEEKAEEIIHQMEQKIKQAQSLVKNYNQAPSVLILSGRFQHGALYTWSLKYCL